MMSIVMGVLTTGKVPTGVYSITGFAAVVALDPWATRFVGSKRATNSTISNVFFMDSSYCIQAPSARLLLTFHGADHDSLYKELLYERIDDQ